MSGLQQPHIADYELLRPIGRGAFGQVWLARGITGQFRAVKILERAGLPSQRAFEREFQGVLRYEPVSRTHPNLVQVLHVGRSADGQSFWYVMELADNAEPEPGNDDRASLSPRAPDAFIGTYEPRTLRTLLRDNRRLSSLECLPIALGLAEAVTHLHARGLVHRDIKPSNVIFVGGTPKLADIGLVTASEEQPSFVGTAGYIPPDGPGTRRADIYALGKVLYEMITGRPAQDFPRLPEDFSTAGDRKGLVEFNEVVIRAADVDPRRALGSAEELRSELLLLKAGRSVRRWRGLERRLRLTSRVGIGVAGIAALSLMLGVWANHERLHALKAEQELAARFVQQQLSLARAVRLTGRPGQRTQSLELIREAAQRTNSLALRNEAIAALALPDVRHFRTFPEVRLVFDDLIRRYATYDADGNIAIRSVEDDRRLARLSVGNGSESCPAPVGLLGFDFSSTGEYLCATYSNRQSLIWRIDSLPPDGVDQRPGVERVETSTSVFPRTVPFAFEPSSQSVVPGGNLVGVEDASGTLHVFDVEKGSEVRTITRSLRGPGIAFNAAGTRFASLQGNSLEIREFGSGALVLSFTNHTGFEGVFWHPDGRQVATVSGERGVRLWNLETGRPSGVLHGHAAEVIGAAVDANGQWMLSVSWDNQTVLWNLAQQKEVLRLHGAGNNIRFSADAHRFAWQSWNHPQWEVFEVTPPSGLVWLEQHPGLETTEALRSLWCLAFLERDVVAAAGDLGFCVWQPPASYASVLAKVGLERPFFALPGRTFFSCGEQGLRRWPITVNVSERTLSLGPPERVSPVPLSAVADFAVSSNCSVIAVINANRQLFLSHGQDRTAWKEMSAHVHRVAVDPAGRFLAATFQGGGVRVWNAEDRSSITNMPCALGRDCSLSPDSRWLVVATMEEYLVWDVKDWHLAHQIRREAVSGPVQAWSPDGGMFLVHDLDSTVRLLRAGTWEELGAIPSPTLLRQICFSPDASRLALLSEKSGIALMDFRRLRQELAALGLDWEGSRYSKRTEPSPRWTIQVETGL